MQSIYRQHGGLLSTWVEYVLDTAQRIDPGLAGVPLYVPLIKMANLRGASGPGLYQTFADEIRASGKHFGRGACTPVDAQARYDDSFAQAVEARLGTDTADEFGKRAVAGLTLHEIGHVIRDNEYGQSPPIGGDARIARRGFDLWANDPPSTDETANPEKSIAWRKHDGPYVRTVCHLAARAARHIPGLKAGDLIDTTLYDLSPIESYVEALRPELSSASGSICQAVFFAPPPKKFAALWHADIKQWWCAIPGAPSREQKQAAIDALALFS